ncbi:MAG: 23S rRNA (adenine(1618)-N(6))-methyltransferase RlmF [Saprospiraceae bacterium]
MKKNDKQSSQLHPDNIHNKRYDFEKLVGVEPELEDYVFENEYGNITIDFSDSMSIKLLNRALLNLHYSIKHWDIPYGYLCPPIPGRADMIHYIHDLIKNKGKSVKVLDIGTGANCIYPLLGNSIYGWSFVATEVDKKAMKAATQIININNLQNSIEIRQQYDKANIFKGAVKMTEQFDVCICNPPFHISKEEADKSSSRKWKNLGIKKESNSLQNFGGKNNELWYPGGEKVFIRNMIRESARRPNLCKWFTTLVSQQSSMPTLIKTLIDAKVPHHKVIPMGQGNKVSRILAWSFTNDQY